MPSFKMKFSGVTILQGVEFSIFSIDFEWALQQCSATALPVMVHVFYGPDALLYTASSDKALTPTMKITHWPCAF